MAVITDIAPPPPLTARRRAFADSGFRYLTVGCGLVVLVVLALIAVSMTGKALQQVDQITTG